MPSSAEIAFIAEDKLAISFFAPASVPRQRLDQSRPGQIDLVSIIVNTKTRKVEKTLTWNTPYESRVPVSEQRLLFPTNQDEFIVYTGAKLLRYSSDFELLQERPILDPIKTKVLISPGRSLLLVADYVRTAKFKEVLVNTSDLSSEKYFGENEGPSSGVTDDGHVLRLRLSKSWSPNSREGSDLSVCTQPLANFPYSQKSCGTTHLGHGLDWFLCASDGFCRSLYSEAGSAALLRDGIVFVDTAKNKGIVADRGFAVLDLDGKVLFKRELGDKGRDQRDSISYAGSSPRFAFSTGHLSLNKGIVNMAWSVHVFDLKTMHELLTLPFKESMPLKRSGYARVRPLDHTISPEGTKLAVIRENELTLYDLPSQP